MHYNIATYVTTRIRPLLLTPEFRFFTNPAATTISPGQKHFFQNFNFPGYNLSLLQILANSVQYLRREGLPNIILHANFRLYNVSVM